MVDEVLIFNAGELAGSNIHTILNWTHAYRYAELAGNHVALRTAGRCLDWFVNQRRRKLQVTKADCDFVADVFLMQEKAKEVEVV